MKGIVFAAVGLLGIAAFFTSTDGVGYDYVKHVERPLPAVYAAFQELGPEGTGPMNRPQDWSDRTQRRVTAHGPDRLTVEILQDGRAAITIDLLFQATSPTSTRVAAEFEMDEGAMKALAQDQQAGPMPPASIMEDMIEQKMRQLVDAVLRRVTRA